jgi:hypothetical protein
MSEIGSGPPFHGQETESLTFPSGTLPTHPGGSGAEGAVSAAPAAIAQHSTPAASGSTMRFTFL